MKKTYKRILTLLMAFALILEYGFSYDSICRDRGELISCGHTE